MKNSLLLSQGGMEAIEFVLLNFLRLFKIQLRMVRPYNRKKYKVLNTLLWKLNLSSKCYRIAKCLNTIKYSPLMKNFSILNLIPLPSINLQARFSILVKSGWGRLFAVLDQENILFHFILDMIFYFSETWSNNLKGKLKALFHED